MHRNSGFLACFIWQYLPHNIFYFYLQIQVFFTLSHMWQSMHVKDKGHMTWLWNEANINAVIKLRQLKSPCNIHFVKRAHPRERLHACLCWWTFPGRVIRPLALPITPRVTPRLAQSVGWMCRESLLPKPCIQHFLVDVYVAVLQDHGNRAHFGSKVDLPRQQFAIRELSQCLHALERLHNKNWLKYIMKHCHLFLVWKKFAGKLQNQIVKGFY